MVINIGLLKTSNFQEVFEELRSVRHVCPEADLTIILETVLLEPLQTIIASMLCREAGADAVMTSTGSSSSPATPKDVSLLRFVLGDDLDVVALADIKKHDGIVGFLKAGVSRLTVGFSDTDDTLPDLIKQYDRPVNE